MKVASRWKLREEVTTCFSSEEAYVGFSFSYADYGTDGNYKSESFHVHGTVEEMETFARKILDICNDNRKIYRRG